MLDTGSQGQLSVGPFQITDAPQGTCSRPGVNPTSAGDDSKNVVNLESTQQALGPHRPQLLTWFHSIAAQFSAPRWALQAATQGPTKCLSQLCKLVRFLSWTVHLVL